jgi:hypothetical protein
MVFELSRSLNANRVIYEAVRDDESESPRLEPVWRMDADRGQREELTWMESAFAYGVERTETSQGPVFAIKALPGRLIRLVPVDGRTEGLIELDGQSQYLRRIHVQLKENSSVSVAWVELETRHAETGETLRTRLTPEGAALAR